MPRNDFQAIRTDMILFGELLRIGVLLRMSREVLYMRMRCPKKKKERAAHSMLAKFQCVTQPFVSLFTARDVTTAASDKDSRCLRD